jgi:hypothetical protein
VCGHAAHSEHATNATHGIRPAAEADEKNTVAGSPQAQNGGIAVDNVSGDAKAGALANEIVNFTGEADLDLAAVGARPEARIVEGKLALGIDQRIRADPRPAVELIDITAIFIDEEAAGLPSAIGEDQDVLRHYRAHVRFNPKADI